MKTWQYKNIKLSAIFMLFFALTCLLSACGQNLASSSAPALVGGSTKRAPVHSQNFQISAPNATDVFATMKTSLGDLRFVLYPQFAPLAVENFCTLASQGFYNGTSFNRIVAGFIAQAGVPPAPKSSSSAWGGPFAVEPSPFLRHYSGALCMVKGDENTNLCQFYIIATPQNILNSAALAKLEAGGVPATVIDVYRQAGGAPYLDNTDTVFGQIVEGMDIVDKIANAAVESESETPKNPVVITEISVENYIPLYVKGRPAYTPPTLQDVPTEIAEEALEPMA